MNSLHVHTSASSFQILSNSLFIILTLCAMQPEVHTISLNEQTRNELGRETFTHVSLTRSGYIPIYV
jgi:hypothetical protein